MIAATRMALRWAATAACAFALASSASAYYHFVHFTSRTGPFVPIPEKFDLASLPNNTVSYYVSATGPVKVFDKDSFAAILSELRFAGDTWNGISTSSLRVTFGGLFTATTPQLTPHIEVTFAEVPPGLIAMGGPTSVAGIVSPVGGQPYVPITKSLLVLNQDLSSQPSYSTGFYLTAVHELGHALGLQHTATSSVMSTDVTRASTKANALAADDIAAMSVLYPNANFASGHGSIAGKVSLGGNGVALASVVAVQSTGEAVSALTNPDGTYEIDGLSPGGYYVYAHTLPPSVQPDLGPSEVVLPVDADGKPFAAGASFATRFYPGTQDPKQAATVTVQTGQTTGSIDFSVNAHAAPALYGVTTYSFPGKVAVKPAYINVFQAAHPFLVASGNGLMSGTSPVPGLTVSTLGSSLRTTQDGVHAYAPAPTFLQVDFLFSLFSQPGPRHLIFQTANETFVLPSSLMLVNSQPPAVVSATGTVDTTGNRVVSISGSQLRPDTKILFDGAAAKTVSTAQDQTSMVVTAPPAVNGYQANIVALNSDGQSSLFLAPPVPYTYDAGPVGTPVLSLGTTALAPGVESMVEVSAANMTFVDGQTALGFGSSDIAVKDLWVVSPTLVRANVYVAGGAQVSDTLVSAVSGFQTASLTAGFHIAGVAGASLRSDVANVDPKQPGVYPGSTVTLPIFNLPTTATAASVSLDLSGVRVPVIALDSAKVTFQIPQTFPTGYAIVHMTAAGAVLPPVFFKVSPLPPVVLGITNANGSVDGTHPAHPGDSILISVSQPADAGTTIPTDRIQVLVKGVDNAVIAPAEPSQADPKIHYVRAILSPTIGVPDKVPVTVSIDGNPSAEFPLAIIN